ncbi:MAG: adenylyltransferase/cytidyltransferase family protein [Verrucomicrobia bacterium]|nr:adenylyltransferase/cytidyltransferase family protein [Verrucomicrobiota bacterium]
MVKREDTPAFLQEKLLYPEELISWREKVTKEKKSLATLNGSFDLLHAGHLHIIFEASKEADLLLVALNSDASIQRYKGKKRPLIPLCYRLEMMASLQFVDFVTWFEEDTPIELLQKVRPDVHVNGADWGANCIEAPTVKEMGGRIHIVSLKQGLSTSRIIEKIHETYSPV